MTWPLKPAPKFSLTIINVNKIKMAVTELAYFLTFCQVSLRLKGIENHIMIIKKVFCVPSPDALGLKERIGSQIFPLVESFLCIFVSIRLN